MTARLTAGIVRAPSRRLLACLAALLIVLGTRAAPAQNDDRDVLVLTSLPATYATTWALARDTRIAVRNVPEGGRSLAAQASYFERRADTLAEDFAQAEAVVTIAKLWRDDPLYLAARSANIRIVEIDATKPWSRSLEGIGIVLEPSSNVPWVHAEPGDREPSVYFWLSPANVTRSAEIIAGDLARLAPDEAAQIDANLIEFRRELLELKREYEVALAGVLDVTLLALAPDFVYLTTDLGLYVDGYFLKQDIDWLDTDKDALTQYLRMRGIRVVIHKWEPDASIISAIEAGGARLVVLDTLETGPTADGALVPRGYVDVLRQNLESLYRAFESD